MNRISLNIGSCYNASRNASREISPATGSTPIARRLAKTAAAHASSFSETTLLSKKFAPILASARVDNTRFRIPDAPFALPVGHRQRRIPQRSRRCVSPSAFVLLSIYPRRSTACRARDDMPARTITTIYPYHILKYINNIALTEYGRSGWPGRLGWYREPGGTSFKTAYALMR